MSAPSTNFTSLSFVLALPFLTKYEPAKVTDRHCTMSVTLRNPTFVQCLIGRVVLEDDQH